LTDKKWSVITRHFLPENHSEEGIFTSNSLLNNPYLLPGTLVLPWSSSSWHPFLESTESIMPRRKAELMSRERLVRERTATVAEELPTAKTHTVIICYFRLLCRSLRLLTVTNTQSGSNTATLIGHSAKERRGKMGEYERSYIALSVFYCAVTRSRLLPYTAIDSNLKCFCIWWRLADTSSWHVPKTTRPRWRSWRSWRSWPEGLVARHWSRQGHEYPGSESFPKARQSDEFTTSGMELPLLPSAIFDNVFCSPPLV